MGNTGRNFDKDKEHNEERYKSVFYNFQEGKITWNERRGNMGRNWAGEEKLIWKGLEFLEAPAWYDREETDPSCAASPEPRRL